MREPLLAAGRWAAEKRMGRLRGRAYGIVLVTAASILWSTAGLFVRLLDADGPLDLWTMLTWRSLFAALSLFLVTVLQYRGRALRAIRGIGWPGLAAAPVSAISMISYVAALKLTTVANVMTIYATVPFVAAGLAFLWIGERVQRRVLMASALALLGIVVMAGAATRLHDIAGNALAFLMTLTFAIVLVMARRYPSLAMAPINALGAALCALLCWPLAAGGMPSLYQLVVLALFGATNTAFAYLLFLIGGRHIPSSEAGLIGMLDVVLGPFWVWLVFAEQPGAPALAGGALVLAAVLWYLAGKLRGSAPARLS
jgi:drug/metabolite transporter (DMT)-like permease